VALKHGQEKTPITSNRDRQTANAITSAEKAEQQGKETPTGDTARGGQNKKETKKDRFK